MRPGQKSPTPRPPTPRFEEHVGTLLCGKGGSDPAQMHQLALRGQQSPIVLPSMRRLQEHSEHVAGWCRELDASLPLRIDPDRACAKFSAQSHRLKITVPEA